MDPLQRSDRALAEQVHAGESRAFAVFFARHAGRVHARLTAEDDPAGAALHVWVRVLRELRDGVPNRDLAHWLDDVTEHQADRPAPEPGPGPSAEELDALWHDLQPYWPSGRRRREPPVWIRPVAVLAALVALAVLVPFSAMTMLREERTPEPSDPELVARPFTGELQAPPDTPDTQDPDLPAFEFPSLDAPSPDPVPEAPPGPTADAAPDPAPVGDGSPEPATPPSDEPAPPEPTEPDPSDGPSDGGPEAPSDGDGAPPPEPTEPPDEPEDASTTTDTASPPVTS